MPDSGIRLLTSPGLLRADSRMHDLHAGKRRVLQEADKTLPAHPVALSTAVQPFPPEADDLPAHPTEAVLIARDPVVRIVAPQLLHALRLLPRDRRVAMVATPGIEAMPGTTQSLHGGLALDDPVALPRASPIVGKAEEVKRPRPAGGRRPLSLGRVGRVKRSPRVLAGCRASPYSLAPRIPRSSAKR